MAVGIDVVRMDRCTVKVCVVCRAQLATLEGALAGRTRRLDRAFARAAAIQSMARAVSFRAAFRRRNFIPPHRAGRERDARRQAGSAGSFGFNALLRYNQDSVRCPGIGAECSSSHMRGFAWLFAPASTEENSVAGGGLTF